MGFGSYDETEQENQERTTEEDEAEAVNVHENEHDGEVSFESEMSTSDLVSKLDEMKDSPDEE